MPTQGLKLSASIAELRRLIKPHAAADEDLVRPDDECSIMTLRHSPGFELGKRDRAVDRRAMFNSESVLDRLLIDRGGFNPELEARCCEQPSPVGLAEARIRSSFIHAMPPRQQLHYRRGGLLDRAARYVDDRPMPLNKDSTRLTHLGSHRLDISIFRSLIVL